MHFKPLSLTILTLSAVHVQAQNTTRNATSSTSSTLATSTRSTTAAGGGGGLIPGINLPTVVLPTVLPPLPSLIDELPGVLSSILPISALESVLPVESLLPILSSIGVVLPTLPATIDPNLPINSLLPILSSIGVVLPTLPLTIDPTLPIPTLPIPTLPISVSLPTIALPNVTLPSVSLPTVSLPSISLPSISVPIISVPSISVPIISVPSISVPIISVPSITVPIDPVPTNRPISSLTDLVNRLADLERLADEAFAILEELDSLNPLSILRAIPLLLSNLGQFASLLNADNGVLDRVDSTGNVDVAVQQQVCNAFSRFTDRYEAFLAGLARRGGILGANRRVRSLTSVLANINNSIAILANNLSRVVPSCGAGVRQDAADILDAFRDVDNSFNRGRGNNRVKL